MNSPTKGSRVNPYTPLPVVRTKMVELEYKQYPAVNKADPAHEHTHG